MKKTVLALFAALLLVGLLLPVEASAAEETEAAERLYWLGLMQGVGKLENGEIDMAPGKIFTREQGVVMMVRLLGKESEALKGRWTVPFDDVSDWALPYVGYAVQNGLACGASAASFNGSAPISVPQFVTYMLQALGYQGGRDFQWNTPWRLSNSLGLTRGAAGRGAGCTRGDAALITWRTLNTVPRNGRRTLLRELLANGAVQRYSSSTLAVCGDMLPHMTIVRDARRRDGSYSFAHVLAGGRPYVAGADYAVANLETTLAEDGFCGYPCFRSPEALAKDLRDLGVDLLMTGNNHCLDSGYDGLVHTLDVLDRAGLPHIGTSRSEQERQNGIRVADVGGISVAFLAYTYATNGAPKPGDKPWCVNTYTTDYVTNAMTVDEELLRQDLRAAKALDTDLVAVMIHWGVEYQTVQNSLQEDLADLLIRNGADMVLGGHPHVLQPCEMRTVEDENGALRRGFVCYSMGNYFSDQARRYTDVTTVLTLKLTRDNLTGWTRVENWTYAPMLMTHTGTLEDAYRLLDAHAGSPDPWIQSKLDRAVQDCHDILGPEHDIANNN